MRLSSSRSPLLAYAIAVLAPACSRGGGDRPDVVLVVVDTLRADHVGCYGYPRPTTPNVDGLAAESTRWEVALSSAPWTGASVSTLFTGLHGSSHGLLTCSAPLGADVLPTDFLAPGNVTLAESLAAAGYRTAGVSSNPWLRECYGYAQGFESFDELPPKAAAAPVTDRAIARYEELVHSGSPLFLYVHYMDAHGPYEPDPPYDTMFRGGEERLLTDAQWVEVEPYLRHGVNRNLSDYVDRYDGGIRQCDEQIGRLLGALDPRLLGRVVVVTADHGEEFFEHGRAGHGYTLFEEMVNVPLVIRVPGRAPALVRAPEFAGLVDLAPTLLELAGVEVAPDRFDGRDLFDSAAPPDAAWAENHTKGRRFVSLRRADSKALFVLGEASATAFTSSKLIGWFDLGMDPREAKDLKAFVPPEVARADVHALGEWADRCGARRALVTCGFTPPERPAAEPDKAALEKLGYVK